MTYTKLIERLREIASVQGFPTDDLVDAADAIEALQEKNALLEGTLESRERNITELQAENERLQGENIRVMGASEIVQAKFDAQSSVCAMLQAENERLKDLEPQPPCEATLHACISYVIHGDADFSGLHPGLVEYFKEHAAPKALEPLTEERIDELEDAAFRDYMEGRIDCYTYAVARAIEAAHGITKGTL